MDVTGEWAIDSPLLSAYVDGEEVTVQFLDTLPLGFRVSFLGTKVLL